jgi:hypothetical protein
MPFCLYNRLTDGGRLSASSTSRSLFPTNIVIFVPGTNFCQRLSKPQDLDRPEGIEKLKNIIYIIGLDPATSWRVA